MSVIEDLISKKYRLGDLPGLTNKRPKAKSDITNQLHFGKKSQYRIHLEKKLHFHYGLKEWQLLKYVCIAEKVKGSIGQVLL